MSSSSSSSRRTKRDWQTMLADEEEDQITKLQRENAQLREEIRRRDILQAESTTAMGIEMHRLRQENATFKQLFIESLRGTLSWDHDVPKEWNHDSEIVAAAIKADEMHWDEVTEPCQSDPDVILAALKSGQIEWDAVPEDYKRNHAGIALFGYSHNHLAADESPCLLDRQSMKEMFLNQFSWHSLPAELKDDIEFARSFEHFCYDLDAGMFFEEFPPLQLERAMWVKAVDADICIELAALVEDFAPAEIRSDRELMLTACTRYPETLNHVATELANDHDFLFTVAGRNARILCFMSHELQRRLPDVVDHALRNSNQGNHPLERCYDMFFHDDLAPEFWEDREFVVRWCRYGLLFPTLPSPNYGNDTEIFLLIARHCNPDWRYKSFSKASMALRGDKKFMLQVLKVAPSLFELVAPTLRDDFDLLLLALSGEHGTAGGRVMDRASLESFRAHVSERLNAHKIFTAIVLPAMSMTVDSGSVLSALDHGVETSFVYKELLAELLDVPTGKCLRRHRQAARNLQKPPGGRGTKQVRITTTSSLHHQQQLVEATNGATLQQPPHGTNNPLQHLAVPPAAVPNQPQLPGPASFQQLENEPPRRDAAARLDLLESLKDRLTPQEYKAKRQEILGTI